jgi:hypothetical protein
MSLLGPTLGRVAGPLGDFLLAGGPLLLELLEPRHRRLEQLEDDRRRDIGHDPEAEYGGPTKVAAGEDRGVLEKTAEPAGILAGLLGDLRQRRLVDPHQRDEEADAVDDQHREREQHSISEVRDAEDVDEGLNHRKRATSL